MWWVVGVVAWLAVAVPLALVVGRAIYLGQAQRPVPSQRRPRE